MPEDNQESIEIRQFDPGECQEGAMEGGETFATSELGDGVQAVMCKRAVDGAAEVQSLIFDKAKFPDDTAAKQWVDDNNVKAWAQRKAEHEALYLGTQIKYHDTPFTAEAGAPGQAIDPENPKASEGMENFKMQVQAALDAAGWTIFGSMEPKWDFCIMELFTDSAIVMDMMSGEYYRIGLSLESDNVTLGEPEKYDITFTPSDGPAQEPAEGDPEKQTQEGPGPAMAAAEVKQQTKFRSHGAPIVFKAVEGEKRPTYEVLIVQSGWTKDGRYMTAESLRDAVAAGMFDRAPMYWQHAPDEPGPKRPGVVCGYIKAGSVRLQENQAGGVDVFGHAVLLNTNIGGDIKEVVDASLESGRPLVGVSIFSKSATQTQGKIENRDGLIITHFDSIDAVDFVEDPAYPRAGITQRVAASATKGNLTMDEKLELERLRKSEVELSAKIRRMETETEVDKSLGESGLPEDRCKLLRPILLSIDSADVRTASLEMSKQDYWRAAKGSTKPGGANDTTTLPTARPLRADVQEAVNTAAKAAGITPEQLAKAQLEVLGVAE